MKDLILEFEYFLRENKLDLMGKKLVLGLSTGVDSSTLLDVLEKAREKNGFDIVICHVNHKKRAQSEEEERFVREKYGSIYPVYIKTLSEDDTRKANFQERARLIRLNFFMDVMKKEHSEYLVLAHHLNDDIETSLFHLIRGGSLASIEGMKEVQSYKDIIILRPFLKVLKKDIEEYALINNIKYYNDESNSEDDYTRNRIRHNIVPKLFDENPRFDNSFLEYKRKLEIANVLINEKRDNFIDDYCNIDESIRIDYDAFQVLDEVIKEEVLFELLKKYKLSNSNIDELVKLINVDKASFVYNYKNFHIQKNKIDNKVYLVICEGKYEKENMEIVIDKVGTFDLGNGRKVIIKTLNEDEKNEKLKLNYISNVNIIWYNIDKFPFKIRNKQDGDVILLDKGHKKIKDLFIDLHMNKSDRDNSLLLVDNCNDVIAVLGVRKSSNITKMGLENCNIEIQYIND